jgi:hypothetical protein
LALPPRELEALLFRRLKARQPKPWFICAAPVTEAQLARLDKSLKLKAVGEKARAKLEQMIGEGKRNTSCD